MAHEMLSVKLYELEQKISQMHSRIWLSETADHEQVKNEIEELKKECKENEFAIRKKIQFSKAKSVGRIWEAYGKVEEIIQEFQRDVGSDSLEQWKQELTEEEKLLFAEYALDFAMEMANRATLISMEAIEAQMSKEEEQ